MLKAKRYAVHLLTLIFLLSILQILADAVSGRKTLGSTTVGGTDGEKGYSIFIEIEEKTLYLLENGECIKEYRIASGKSGSPSPLGCWKIVEKGDWGEGFGGRWMGLDVP